MVCRDLRVVAGASVTARSPCQLSRISCIGSSEGPSRLSKYRRLFPHCGGNGFRAGPTRSANTLARSSSPRGWTTHVQLPGRWGGARASGRLPDPGHVRLVPQGHWPGTGKGSVERLVVRGEEERGADPLVGVPGQLDQRATPFILAASRQGWRRGHPGLFWTHIRHYGACRGQAGSLTRSRDDETQAPRGKVTRAGDRAYNGAAGTPPAGLTVVGRPGY